jgi:hypothetical protein
MYKETKLTDKIVYEKEEYPPKEYSDWDVYYENNGNLYQQESLTIYDNGDYYNHQKTEIYGQAIKELYLFLKEIYEN